MPLKKNILGFIISMMSIALIGLISLQIYWLSITVEVNEERFHQNVLHALDNVVKKLEQREAFYLTQKEFNKEIRTDDHFLIMIDSIENIYQNPNQSTTIRQVSAKDSSYSVPWQSSNSRVALNLPPQDNFRINPLKKDFLQDLQSQQLIKIARKSNMVSFIVSELVSLDKEIEERISRDLLDSLLETEFKSKGISTPFEYGVSDGNKNLVFCANQSKQEQIIKEGFIANLFPSDVLVKKPNLLYVFFPNQKAFILSQMALVLGSSVLLIALIIACFAYSVHIIISQKKLSEITNDFINNMTHELKTPISTVSLASEALLDPDMQKIPNQLNRYVGIIKEENTRLGEQVEKVLQIARLDRKDFSLQLKKIEVHTLIEKAMNSIALQIEDREGRIISSFKAQNAVIEADEEHLLNIIKNLLDNANKYSPGNPEISIQTKNVNKGVRITISDKGQGISKDKINKIFDKFYRVSSGNIHDVKGFGLGLSYVKSMVEAHKGSITVKSELNKGSSFSIFLPFQQKTT